MQQLLLVNPRKRGSARRKPRSAAQKAATRRMLSANRSKHSGKKHSYASNPAPGRRARSLVTRHVKRSSPRRRRNPINMGSITAGIMPMLKTAAMAAGGAIAVDVAYGYANQYLPASIKSPVDTDGSANYAYYAGKGIMAIVLGMVAKKVIGANKANRIVEGSLTVTLHDLAKVLVTSNMSSVKMGYLNPGMQAGSFPNALPSAVDGLGAYVSGMGEYLSGGNGGMSYGEGIEREDMGWVH